MKLLIAALLTAASLSICAAPSVIAGDKPVSPTKPIVKNPLAEADRQLKAAEAKWKKKRPEHYSYTLQRSCFCAPDYRKPIEIRVFRGDDPALVAVDVIAEAEHHRKRLLPGQNGGAGIALLLGGVKIPVIALQLKLRLLRPHLRLLQTDDIRVRKGAEGQETFIQTGPQPVHIP